MKNTEKKERNREISYQRYLGRTYKEIGEEHGITGTAVRLICIKEDRNQIQSLGMSERPRASYENLKDNQKEDALGLFILSCAICEITTRRNYDQFSRH